VQFPINRKTSTDYGSASVILEGKSDVYFLCVRTRRLEQTLTTTFLKRQKEHKRHEKAKAKAEVRRNKAIARRAQEENGQPIADADVDAPVPVTDANGQDIENPT
jgi:hypothetical protein